VDYGVVSDTSVEAAQVQYDLMGRAGPVRRFEMCREMTAGAIALSRRALARARPELSAIELSIEWIAIQYGTELADRVRRRLRARR
jgi:hypothetical protein